MRRKGEVTVQQTDRDYPHQVEIVVPPCGLRHALEAMDRFCNGTDYRTRSAGWQRRRELGHDAVRWCFRSAEAAKAFQAQFGGQVAPPLTQSREFRRG